MIENEVSGDQPERRTATNAEHEMAAANSGERGMEMEHSQRRVQVLLLQL